MLALLHTAHSGINSARATLAAPTAVDDLIPQAQLHHISLVQHAIASTAAVTFHSYWYNIQQHTAVSQPPTSAKGTPKPHARWKAAHCPHQQGLVRLLVLMAPSSHNIHPIDHLSPIVIIKQAAVEQARARTATWSACTCGMHMARTTRYCL